MRIVCVDCRVEMRAERNNIAAEAMTDSGPYQLFSADLWRCPTCGKQVIAGFGSSPLSEHFKADYAGWLAAQSERGHFQYWANEQEKSRYKESCRLTKAGG